MKKIAKLLAALLTVAMLSTTVFSMNVSAAIANYTSLFTSGVFSDTEEINGTMSYRLYVPQDYDPNVSYPLLVFLHGYGERGNNTGTQLTVASFMTHYFTEERMAKYPCIILAPQCPMETTWADTTTDGNWGETDYNFTQTNENIYSKLLVQLMGKLEDEYNIDSSRRYITGLSMGGFGTWEVIMHHHDLFAAAAPLCGGTSSSQAPNLVNLPIWNFHGAVDPTINLTGSRNMYNAMANLAANDSSLKVLKYVESKASKNSEVWNDIKDANYIYTEYTDVDHFCWDHAYEEQYFYDWMFNQHNENAPKLTNNAKCAPNYAYKGTLFDNGGTYADGASLDAAGDGDLGTAWQYSAKADGSYLGVKWDDSKDVNKVYVYWNKGDRATASESGYTVEYSTDGTNWQAVPNPVYTFSNIRGGAIVDTVDFDKVKAKAVRVVINSSVGKTAARIYELGVFDTTYAVKNGGLWDDIKTIIEIDSTNVAAEGTAFDDNKQLYSGTALEYLNDGNYSTSWQYSGTPSYPLTAAISFANEKTANSIALYWEIGTRSSSYTVEYSTDGVTWQEVPNAVYSYGANGGNMAQDIITFDAVSAKYYRCNISGGSNSKYYPKLYEFEIHNTVEDTSAEYIINIDSTDIATQGTAIDDGKAYYGSSVATNLNDGNRSTSWQYSGTPSYPINAGVSFASAKQANSIALYWEIGTRSSDYKIEYSNDGVTWQEVPNPIYSYGKAGATSAQDIISFDAVNAKYFRCNITGGTNTKYYPKLYEMEIYKVAAGVNFVLPINGNVATEGTVFEEDKIPLSSGTAATNLNDGNRSTSWQYSGDPTEYPINAGVSFGSSKKANTVALYWEVATRSSDYTIEYSTDGVTWKAVSNASYKYGVEVGNLAQDIITFDAVSAKYYRCKITGGNSGKYYPKLYEIEIYNA